MATTAKATITKIETRFSRSRLTLKSMDSTARKFERVLCLSLSSYAWQSSSRRDFRTGFSGGLRNAWPGASRARGAALRAALARTASLLTLGPAGPGDEAGNA